MTDQHDALGDDDAVLVDEVTADALRAVDTPSAESDAEVAVHRDEERHVYSATLEDRELGFLRYADADGRTIVVTTVVEPEFRGRGIASALIADALDDLRERGIPLEVQCPVVRAFIRSNVAFADLIPEG